MEASLLRLAVSFCPVSRPRVAPPNGKQRRIPLRTLSCTGRLTGLGPRLARPVGIWNTWVNVCPGNKTGATPAKRGGGAQVQPWAALERPVRRGPRPHAMRVLPPKPVDHHGRRSSARRTRVRDELEQSTRGVAQSGLARLTGGQKVAGSNPVAPTVLQIEPFGENVEGLSPYSARNCLSRSASVKRMRGCPLLAYLEHR
jgi:hypothetical protein